MIDTVLFEKTIDNNSKISENKNSNPVNAKASKLPIKNLLRTLKWLCYKITLHKVTKNAVVKPAGSVNKYDFLL